MAEAHYGYEAVHWLWSTNGIPITGADIWSEKYSLGGIFMCPISDAFAAMCENSDEN